jgi:hypothetical protein
VRFKAFDDPAPEFEVLGDFINDLNATFVRALKCRPEHAVLTEDGEVMRCDLLTWARFMKAKQRIIAQEQLSAYWLSTVFLGLDHGHDWGGPQLWFETMIFEPPAPGEMCPLTGPPLEHGNSIYCERFSTLKEALAGHQSAKDWLAKQLPQ